MIPLLFRSAGPLERDACTYYRSNPHIRPNQATMKFEPSASSALWPPVSRPSLRRAPGRIHYALVRFAFTYVRLQRNVRRAQIDPRDAAGTTLVGVTHNWWRRQACLPFGPNQSKTLLASFALDLAAMDGSLARYAAQAVRVAVCTDNPIRVY